MRVFAMQRQASKRFKASRTALLIFGFLFMVLLAALHMLTVHNSVFSAQAQGFFDFYPFFQSSGSAKIEMDPKAKYRGFYKSAVQTPDFSPRCLHSGICDDLIGVDPGTDGLGTIINATERRDHIKEACRESWKAYR